LLNISQHRFNVNIKAIANNREWEGVSFAELDKIGEVWIELFSSSPLGNELWG